MERGVKCSESHVWRGKSHHGQENTELDRHLHRSQCRQTSHRTAQRNKAEPADDSTRVDPDERTVDCTGRRGWRRWRPQGDKSYQRSHEARNAHTKDGWSGCKRMDNKEADQWMLRQGHNHMYLLLAGSGGDTHVGSPRTMHITSQEEREERAKETLWLAESDEGHKGRVRQKKSKCNSQRNEDSEWRCNGTRSLEDGMGQAETSNDW